MMKKVSKPEKSNKGCTKLENISHGKLIDFVNCVKVHHHNICTFAQKCKSLAENLKNLSIRQNILNQFHPDAEIYPDFVIEHVQQQILNDESDKMLGIEKNMQKLASSYEDLSSSYESFESSCHQFKWNSKSVFVQGNEKQKPLEYFLETGHGILFYFNSYQLNLKFYTTAIDLKRSETFDKFIDSLEICQDFQEYLNLFLCYCRMANLLNE